MEHHTSAGATPRRCLGVLLAAVLAVACSGGGNGGPSEDEVLDWMANGGMTGADVLTATIRSSSDTGRESFRLVVEGEATFTDDQMERLNPFVWAELCGIDNPEEYDIPGAERVYTLRIEAGDIEYVANTTAFVEDDEWNYTVTKFSYLDGDGEPVFGTPRPFIEDDAAVVGTPEFDTLCIETLATRR